MKNSYSNLSKEALELLSEPITYDMLSIITKEIGVTPEEYLMRFEEALSTNPNAIFEIFDAQKIS